MTLSMFAGIVLALLYLGVGLILIGSVEDSVGNIVASIFWPFVLLLWLVIKVICFIFRVDLSGDSR